MSTEDELLFLAPVLGAAATFFGASSHSFGPFSPFLLAVVFAAAAKALPSLAQNIKSYEDWLLFLATFLGALSTAFSANPAYAMYGVIAGLLLKAVLSFKGATKATLLEDGLLAVSVLIAGYAQLAGVPDLANLAILFGTVAKALPSGVAASAPTPAG